MTMPQRTMWKARPMAWAPEAQAVEMVSAGPVMLLVDGDLAGAVRGHGAEDGEGMDAGVAGVDAWRSRGLLGLAAVGRSSRGGWRSCRGR